MYELKTKLTSLRNQDWRTVKAETEKNKRIINTYLNEKHNRIKRINLCGSKISLWKDLGSPKKHEQKIRIYIRNSTGNIYKKNVWLQQKW